MTKQTVDQTLVQLKNSLVPQLRKAMKRRKVSQSELARRMGTSRAVVHRLLKSTDTSCTFSTLASAAQALSTSVLIKLRS